MGTIVTLAVVLATIIYGIVQTLDQEAKGHVVHSGFKDLTYEVPEYISLFDQGLSFAIEWSHPSIGDLVQQGYGEIAFTTYTDTYDSEGTLINTESTTYWDRHSECTNDTKTDKYFVLFDKLVSDKKQYLNSSTNYCFTLNGKI